jgi:sarcosine oxidase delta subunit
MEGMLTMAEHIERELACEDCIHYDICIFHHYGDENKKCPHFKNKADVADLRHGEWVFDTNYTGKHKEIWVCSVCNHYQYKRIGSGKRDNPDKMLYMFYCPFCGAKMDGKGEEE